MNWILFTTNMLLIALIAFIVVRMLIRDKKSTADQFREFEKASTVLKKALSIKEDILKSTRVKLSMVGDAFGKIVFQNDDYQIIDFTMTPDQSFPEHFHTKNHQIFIPLEGHIIIIYGNDGEERIDGCEDRDCGACIADTKKITREFKCGMKMIESVFVPCFVYHTVVAKTECRFLIISIPPVC
jgi:mannose-6-phosphate isomerase-like protein (cupin superfamily)